MVEFANRVAERSPPVKSTSARVAFEAMLRTLSVMALTSSREYIVNALPLDGPERPDEMQKTIGPKRDCQGRGV